MLRSVVLSTGSYLPARVMKNAEFEARLDTNDAWIRERTGIEERRIAAEGELTSDLGANAARAALARAGVDAASIDLIVLATTTPDESMPATATRIQAKLGTRGAAFDVNAACSGFVYALTVADSLLRTGAATRALVIGAEIFTRILNWEDRGTCILFGDGAGAIVLEAQKEGQAGGRGVLSTKIHSDGKFGDILHTNGGVASTKTAGTVEMQGKEVFRHASLRMSEGVREAIAPLGGAAAIDWLVPHQANARILASVAEKAGILPEKVISTVHAHANTSAASIPLALDVANGQGKLKAGQTVVLTALGAGLTWGTCVVKW